MSEDLALALDALEAGELRHAAVHVAAALADDPLDDRAQAVLDRIVDVSDEPDALLPLGKGAWFGEVAAHAWVRARRGEHEQALAVLARVAAVRPDLPYPLWMARWVRDARTPPEPDPLLRLAGRLLRGSVGRQALRNAERAALEPLGVALDAMVRRHPEHALLAVVTSAARRRLGDAEGALALAERAHARTPSYDTAVAVGLSARQLGRWEQAAQAFDEARLLAPADPRPLAELARVRWDAGDAEGALALRRAFEAAGGESGPEATLTLEHLAWRAGRGPRSRLAELAGSDATPDDVTLATLPGIGWLRPRGDATVNALRRLIDERRGDAIRTLSLRVTHLECPSALLSVAMVQGVDPAEVDVEVLSVAEPDPRQPRRALRWRLWRHVGEPPEVGVRRVMPPPEPVVAEAVAAMAARPYYLPAWWRAASLVAADLGVGAVEDLLGCMVHPPQVPPGWTSFDWLQHVQVAAALVLGRLGETGRQALDDLLNGPADWTTEAAALALVERALDDPDELPALRAQLREALDAVPGEGDVLFGEGVAAAILRLPANPSDLERAAQALLDELRSPAQDPSGSS